ncbi:MAG TPA: hypothetical protein DCZ91_05005 [Lachnospiraceae bacterium]|nr:hypothetical protein [Lachnospiraceae bacterium]
MKRKKLIALLLASAMAFGMTACGNGDTPADSNASGSSDAGSASSDESQAESSDESQTESTDEGSANGTADGTFENKVIMGNTTDLTGDFRFPGWGTSSVGASDQDIGRLTIGYGTQEVAEDGNLVWNETSVKSHTETENEDGTATFTVELNEGLTFSDGTPITARNYLAATLSFASPVSMEAGRPGTSGMAFVGYEQFNKYTGEEAEGTSREFTGIRLLSDYSYSVTVSSDYYPYYFAYTYAGFDPAPLGLVLGDDVDILDDGNGVYLSENFYEKNGDSYVKAKEIEANRYDLTRYPFSGAYVVSDWDASTKQATMTLNPEYKGNYEGQTPSIETIVYVKLSQETQLEALTTGGTDILGGVTGGNDTTAALAVVDGENFVETHYQRAGYGKIEFDCDFGPTMFQEVRQAVAYLLNRTEFCQTFTGGYGVVVDGPYSPDLAPWKAVQDDIDLIDYSFSPETARKVLEDGGWIYNSKGEEFVAGICVQSHELLRTAELYVQPLSPPVLRRTAAADLYRPLPGREAEICGLRRMCVRTGRFHPVPDYQPAAGAEGERRADIPVHFPQSVRSEVYFGTYRRYVSGQYGGGGRNRRDFQRSKTSLHHRPAVLHPHNGPG